MQHVPCHPRPRFLALLDRCDACLAAVERTAVVILLTGLIGLGLYQLLLRNLFASGLFWGDALLRHLVLWLGFLGASLATRERQHLSIDALARVFPAGCQPWLTLLTNLTAALVCTLLFQAAWRFVQDEYAAGTMLVPGVSTWLAESIMPFGLSIMALRFFLRVLEISWQLRQRVPPR
jgi:TRAP-type C4-dicarboxylate transport system permease small subunit